jgi:hypothetical protein
MCYFAHAVTSRVASAPRLAEDVAAFVPVSLPARARKALLASDQSQIERTPFLASLCSPLHDFFQATDIWEAALDNGGCSNPSRLVRMGQKALAQLPFAVWIGGGRD